MWADRGLALKCVENRKTLTVTMCQLTIYQLKSQSQQESCDN